jgi:hypothetical protein
MYPKSKTFLSFEEWLEKFLIAEAVGNKVPASRTLLPKSRSTDIQALPAKKKRTLNEDRLELVTAVPYLPLFKDDKDFILRDLSDRSVDSCLALIKLWLP